MAEQRQRRTARTSPPEAAPSKSTSRGPKSAALRACRRLEELIDHPAEGASAVRRTETGWTVEVDVVEVPRIPDTTSLLATFEVELGHDGELLGYRRTRRYHRGMADD